MKNDIHPQVHPVIFVDASNGVEFVTRSTASAEETRDLNGVDHQVLRVEVTSASHPFYTGEQRFVDTAGQVEKFKQREEKVAQAKAARGDETKKDRRKSKDGKSKDTKKEARSALKDALSED